MSTAKAEQHRSLPISVFYNRNRALIVGFLQRTSRQQVNACVFTKLACHDAHFVFNSNCDHGHQAQARRHHHGRHAGRGDPRDTSTDYSSSDDAATTSRRVRIGSKLEVRSLRPNPQSRSQQTQTNAQNSAPRKRSKLGLGGPTIFSCRKAGVVTVHAKSASKNSEILAVDNPRKLAELCLDALKTELSRHQYRHVVRVWLPEEKDIALGAIPDRILVQIREFAEYSSSDGVDKALTTELPMKIMFRDDAVIVVDKPANVLSVDGTDPDAPVSVHRCIARIYPEARMVHRLDQETSGLLVVALTKSAAQSLNAQFRDRSVEKTYVARVHGWMDNRDEESESPRRVRVPMEKHPTRPLVQHVVLDREVDPSSSLWSVTEYCIQSRTIDSGEVEEELKSTMVELKPVTGKTHQLRLHMQHLRHPILGDSLYSPDLVYHRASHLCLHAAKLSFTHPVTNERLKFESSCPADFFTTKETKGVVSQRPQPRRINE